MKHAARWFLLSALMLLGCGGAEDRGLSRCPDGDAAWIEARDRARADKTLTELRARAREIAATCPDRWQPPWLAGETHFYARELEPAMAAYGDALELARSASDSVGISRSANRLAWLTHKAGRLEEADTLYLEAAASADGAGRRDLAAAVANNRAGLLLQTGDLDGAGRLLETAASTLTELGETRKALTPEYNHGVVLLELGDAVAARRVLEGWHRKLTDLGEHERAARAAVTLGRLHLSLDEREAARSWLDRVPETAGEQAARARIYLGRLHVSDGALAEAAAAFESASAGTKTGLTRLFAEMFRAEVELLRGSPAGALGRLARVLAEAEPIGAQPLLSGLHWRRGRALREQGDLPAAIAAFEQSVAILEGMGSTLDPTREGLRFLRDRTGPYVDLATAWIRGAGSALDPPTAQRVLSLIERAHARGLRHALADSQRALAESVSLPTVQAALREGDVLVDFLIGEGSGVALVVRRGATRGVILPGWATLRGPLARYRAAIASVPAGGTGEPLDLEAIPEAAQVADALLGPLGPSLLGAGRVYVVPDGLLANVPPAALPWRGDGRKRLGFLGEAVETALLPLAGPPTGHAGPRTPMLLGGDPLADEAGAFPSLPYSARELQRIGELWRDDAPRVLQGAGFSRQAFLEADLERYRTVHLATHAVASTLSPSQCAIVFSNGGKLGFDEIASLRLGPALVVLSACRSGEGEVVPGEGVIGLSWALLRAGARALAVSQWRVADAASARLMLEFHRGLHGGDDPVRAMAAARRVLRATHPHPAYWAPFTIVLRPGDAG